MCDTYETAAVVAEKKSWTDRLGDIWATTYVVLHFVPLLSTVAWIIYFIAGCNDDLLTYLAPVMALGSLCALLTHPIAILWSMIKRIAYAFWRPLVYVPVIPMNIAASALCGGIMATLCLGALLVVPGALTLYYFFSEE